MSLGTVQLTAGAIGGEGIFHWHRKHRVQIDGLNICKVQFLNIGGKDRAIPVCDFIGNPKASRGFRYFIISVTAMELHNVSAAAAINVGIPHAHFNNIVTNAAYNRVITFTGIDDAVAFSTID